MTWNHFESMARWDNTSILADIALHHLSLLHAEQERVAQIRKVMPTSEDEALEQSYEAFEPKRAADRHAHIVVAFTAFAVESSINSYGGRRLGDRYFEAHLDKLPTVDKWLIVPRLVTGKIFPKDKHAFGLLKSLFQWRNMVVHPKSRNANLEDMQADAESVDGKERKFLAFASGAGRVFHELAIEAHELDPDDLFFGRFFPYIPGRPFS